MKRAILNHVPFLLAVGWAILIGIAFILLAETTPMITDSIGYVYAAERLADGQGLTYDDPNNQYGPSYFTIYAFQIRRPDTLQMFLGFPPGVSLLLAVGILLTGQTTAVSYVVPLLAVLGLLAAFGLGALILENEWGGFWTAVLVSLAPIYWQFGTAVWSEIPAMLFVTSGILFYLLSRQDKRPLNQRLIFSIGGALLLWFSLFIRYANVSFFLALGLYELISARKRLFAEKERWLFFIILGCGVCSILLFNHFYYGSVTLTSYSPAHGWYPFPAFSLSYALGPSFADGYSLKEAVLTLWDNFPILLMMVPASWLVIKRSYALLIAVVILGSVGLYGIYAFAPTGNNARFLLPVFPFVAVSIASVILKISQFLPSPFLRMSGSILLLVLLLGVSVPEEVSALQARNQNNINTRNRVQNYVEFSEKDSIFLSYTFNDQIAYYGPRSVLNYRRIPPSDPENERFQYEWLEPCLSLTVSHLLQAGKPVYYLKEPNSWDPLEILQTHFELTLVRESPDIYQVALPTDFEGSMTCPP